MQKGQIVLIFRLLLHKTDHKRRFLLIQPSFLEMILKTFKFYSPHMKLVLLSPSLNFGNNIFLCTTAHIYIDIHRIGKFFYTHIFKNPNLKYPPSLNVKLLKGKPAFFTLCYHQNATLFVELTQHVKQMTA